jgi:membrane protein implicated in regulation of membrane protease activity
LNLLQRIAGAVVGVLLFVLALVFASVIFAAVAVLAVAAWAWLLWRTRHLPRRGARAGTGSNGRTSTGTVIEGEYRVEREVRRIDADTRQTQQRGDDAR